MRNKLQRKLKLKKKKKISLKKKNNFLLISNWSKKLKFNYKHFLRRETFGRRRHIKLKWKDRIYWKNTLRTKYFIKSYYYKLFLKKLLGSFVKCGKKQMIIINFFKVFSLIKKFWQKSLNLFFNVLYLNLKPVMFTRIKHMGRTPYKLPWIYTYLHSKKYNKIAINWLKKSLKIRSEKTFILRLYSELKDIYLNKGLTIRQKKSMYYNLYKSRSNFRFLRFLEW